MQYEATVPDVVDRVVQEAVREVLEPLWEPTFHPSSHGFRPGRSCHTAITEAKTHLEDGYEWVVDLDLERFFDLVCHQRLTARLAERVGENDGLHWPRRDGLKWPHLASVVVGVDVA